MSLSQRFTLDDRSFEKLLAAAWVLQCVHDQLHYPSPESGEAIAGPVKSEKAAQSGNPSLQAAAKPKAALSPAVTSADSEPELLSWRTVLPAAGLTSTASKKARGVDLRSIESTNGHPVDVAAVQATSMPCVGKPESEESTLRRPPINVRTTFDRAPDINKPIYRISLTLRALRAAIATPALLLATVAALLLVEAWRNEPFHYAQATSSLGIFDNSNKKIPNAELRRSSPSLQVSHMRVTDPVTFSVVEELSRYEIRGLRRQATFGDADAAFTLGMAFETGRHVPQSCTQAMHWVAIAAEGGNAAAQYNLGLRYRDGDGVPADRAESEKWLRKASAAGNPKAQLALKMLSSG